MYDQEELKNLIKSQKYKAKFKYSMDDFSLMPNPIVKLG